MSIRLLYDATDITGSLEERLKVLGFLPPQIHDLKEMCVRGGLSIISGATGHGKSTVLKHIMEALVEREPMKAYFSVEDPPEYRIHGVNQIQVHTQVSADSGQRAMQYRESIAGAMRSDVDVLMIGEIRYAEAAEAAISCAQTGHKVWTTLHAADAFSCIARLEALLRQLAIPNPLEVICERTVLQGLCYQRLLPVLCPDCKKPLKKFSPKQRREVLGKELAERVKKSLSRGKIFLRGEGCSTCQGQGNVSMTVAAETVLLNQELLDLLLIHDFKGARALWKEQGGKTYLESALLKIAQGEVDPRDAEIRLGVQLA